MLSTAISCLLSFVSSKPNLVGISGCSSMIFRALETCGLFDHGIQYPFRFEVLSLPELMHPGALQTRYVFGRIDIFSQLKFLDVFFRGGPSQPWVLQCPGLCKVIYLLIMLFLFLFRLCIPFWSSTLSCNFWLHP